MKQTFKPVYSVVTLYFTEIEKFHAKLKKNVLDIDFKNFKSSNVGFYYELAKAKQCVEEGWGSLDECGYYNHLVIQRTFEGLYNLRNFGLAGQSEWWYRLNNGKGRTWISCRKPKLLKSIVNFA